MAKSFKLSGKYNVASIIKVRKRDQQQSSGIAEKWK
jgi:hypothetical protein